MARERGRQYFLDQLRDGKPIRGELLEDLVATIFGLAGKTVKAVKEVIKWGDVADKPATFPPSKHTHSEYLTEETDPTVPAHVKGISQADIDLWNTPSAPAVALNDLTDVDTTGQATGDVLTLQSDGLWKPQAIESGAVAASRIIDGFRMYARGSSRERDIVYDPIRDAVIWATGAGITNSLDGGPTQSFYAPGYSIGSGSWLSWDEGRGRVLWVPNDSNINGYSSVDGGASWTNLANLNRGPSGFPRSKPRYMSFPSSGRLFRIGSYYGEVDYSDDAGATWTDTGLTFGGTGETTHVGYDSRGFVWFIRGSTFVYSNDGSSWSSNAIGTDGTSLCVIASGTYSGRFVVCREDGTKVRYSSDPRSISWASPTNSFSLNLPKEIFHIPGTNLLAVISNNNKAIAYSTDGAVSWTQYSDIIGTNNGSSRPVQTAFRSVCFMHAAADGSTVTALRWGP